MALSFEWYRIADKVITLECLIVLNNKTVPVAQRIRRETTNLKIAGSNPVGDILLTQLLF